MSRRQGLSGKSLKGDTLADASFIDNSLFTTGQGGSLFGTTLENVSIFSGTADDLIIGSAVQASGAFSELTVGHEGGPSGNVTFWGSAAGNYVHWNPDTANLDLQGSLSLRDALSLGNIRIYDNTIEAIAPNPNGDINLIPRGNGSINLKGNVDQTSSGHVRFSNTTDFTVSSEVLNLDVSDEARLSTRQGDITISTDYPAPTTIGIVSVQNSPIGTNRGRVTVSGLHSMLVGDNVTITGSNASPSVNGQYTVLQVITPQSFDVQLSQALSTAGQNVGTVTRQQNGSIKLLAGDYIEYNVGVPLRFGTSSRLQIEGQVNNTLNVSGDYIVLQDPIPQIQTPSGAFSDSGWQVAYQVGTSNRRGFFGFKGDTTHFTWIPDATITRNIDGTKSVTGAKGVLEVAALLLTELTGDPDLTLNASRHIILNAGQSIQTPMNIPLRIGNTSLTHSATNGNLQIAGPGDIVMNAATGKGIVLPMGSPLVFNGSTRTQTIEGSTNELTITTNATLNLRPPTGGNIHVPDNVYLNFGVPAFQRIYSDGSGINVESPYDINLRPGFPNGAVRVPVNTKVVYGDNSDFIQGGGTAVGLTVSGSAALTLASAGNVFVQPVGGMLQSSGRYLSLPGIADIQFGTAGNVLSATSNLLTLNASAGAVTISAATDINLTATSLVNVPMNTRMTFGGRGQIWQDTNKLHISGQGADELQIDAARTVVNGELHVYGTVTWVHSETTTFSDPILHLAQAAPMGDIKDRGWEFTWWDGPYVKSGAMYWDQSAQEFVLASEVLNNNEILSANTLGDLKLRHLSADSFSTQTLQVNEIVGQPDLHLVADGGSIYMEPSVAVRLPLNVPITSGTNALSSTLDGWVMNTALLNVTGGHMLLGGTVFEMTDINNLRVWGVPNVWLDTNVIVSTAIHFGSSQVQVGIDESQNLLLSTPADINLMADVIVGGTVNQGNASLGWLTDVPGGRLLWHNTSATTPLYLYIEGAIYEAEWKGQPISADFGGTGHIGAWGHGSVVFANSSGLGQTFLDENNANFYWDNTNFRLGIRTSTPPHAFTIGNGHVDLQSNNANVYFRQAGLYGFGFGKTSSGNLLSVKVSGTPTSSTAMLQSALTVTPYGQVGINLSDGFMSTLSGTLGEAQLYISGDQRFTAFDTKLGWSSSQYFRGTADGRLHVHSSSNCTFHCSAMFNIDAQFLESTSRIYGSAGGRLNIAANTGNYFRSLHNVFVGRCCLGHDTVSDVCLSWFEYNAGTTTFSSSTGNLVLNPQSSVTISGTKELIFGSGQGRLSASGVNLRMVSDTGSIVLDGLTGVSVPSSDKLTFGGVTSLWQDGSTFKLTTTTNVLLDTPGAVTIPDNTKLQFGGVDRYIVSDGVVLHIVGTNAVEFDTPVVRINGDLVVVGTTTEVALINSEVDGAILQLGGGSMWNVVGISNWGISDTLITVDAVHHLIVGDTVRLTNTNPDVNGEYTIQSVPTATTFVVSVVTPPIVGPISGQARAKHTDDMGLDVGVQVNWHTGLTPGTGQAKTAFFGFDRSTERFAYYRDATITNGIVSGQLGDVDFAGIHGTALYVVGLGANLNAGGYLLEGTNFKIDGGVVNGTTVGLTVAAAGRFTDLTIDGVLSVVSSATVTNLNADMVDGKHAVDLVLRDGTQSLTADWVAGNYRITVGQMALTGLGVGGVVYVDAGGVLATSVQLSYTGGTLNVAQLSGFKLMGDVDGNGNTVSDITLRVSAVVDSDITLGVGNTLDADSGTVIFGVGQLHGSWVAGGTAAINISGSAATVVDGLYRSNFDGNSILKADVDNTPVALVVGESRLVGRKVGGVIDALTPSEVRQMLNVSEAGQEDVYGGGALMRSGHLDHPDGGAMTGLLYWSWERVTMQSNQTVTLNEDKQLSYVTVTTFPGQNMGVVNLPNGNADGQVKYIVVSSLGLGSMLKVACTLVAPGTPNKPGPFTGVIVRASGSSVMFVWDNVAGTWVILGTGAYTTMT